MYFQELKTETLNDILFDHEQCFNLFCGFNVSKFKVMYFKNLKTIMKNGSFDSLNTQKKILSFKKMINSTFNSILMIKKTNMVCYFF